MNYNEIEIISDKGDRIIIDVNKSKKDTKVYLEIRGKKISSQYMWITIL